MTPHPDLHVRGHRRVVASAAAVPMRGSRVDAAQDWFDARIAERDAAGPRTPAPVLPRGST